METEIYVQYNLVLNLFLQIFKHTPFGNSDD